MSAPAIGHALPALGAPAVHALASSVIRQSLIPMLVGYLVLMTTLGLALIRLRRHGLPPPRRPGEARPPAERRPGGWLALARHAAATALGGYLLLVAVDVGYYYGVAKVRGDFLSSAITGPAVLAGLAVPVFAAASVLLERRRARRP